VAVDVSGHDYWGQQQTLKRFHRRRSKLFTRRNKVNYLSLLVRASSLMIRQNSLLMETICPPDVLIDIQMNRYDGMDFDKSERLVEIGRRMTAKTLSEISK
jgi:hypothetical protein